MLAAARIAVTAATAGLGSAYVYYPHQVWIPVAMSVLTALGTHLVPSVGQPGKA